MINFGTKKQSNVRNRNHLYRLKSSFYLFIYMDSLEISENESWRIPKTKDNLYKVNSGFIFKSLKMFKIEKIILETKTVWSRKVGPFLSFSKRGGPGQKRKIKVLTTSQFSPFRYPFTVNPWKLFLRNNLKKKKEKYFLLL